MHKRFLFALILAIAIGSAFIFPASPASKPATIPQSGNYATAVFAGGCFWCMESSFEKISGVIQAISGYAGGRTNNPTYEEVSSGGTGHAESIQVIYDPHKITYTRLLQVFWHNVDPTDDGGQFCDRGNQYRSEVFYSNESEKKLAEQSKAEIEKAKKFKEPIVTRISPLKAFYPAEEYHQDFYKK